MSQPIQFMMIGGFLGAGKTTLISRLARQLQAEGKHVCIVTNDQAAGLVDTELLKSQGHEVNEVAGSCFCCNFDGLTDAMEEFEQRRRPDVILAEPVGSCTDLVATIALPLMERMGEKFLQSPYAVVLKPNHGKKILSGAGGGFSEKAEYIFRKQLEESELILINRSDELTTDALAELEGYVQEQYPGRKIICLSAKTGENFDKLYEALAETSSLPDATMEVDYDIYAEGEAELGWLNATIVLRRESPLSLDETCVTLVEQLKSSLRDAQAEPGHLKVLCHNPTGSATSVANLIDSDSEVMFSHASEAKASEITMIVNARVQSAPEALQQLVEQTIAGLATQQESEAQILTMTSFRPGRPVPTHRSTR